MQKNNLFINMDISFVFYQIIMPVIIFLLLLTVLVMQALRKNVIPPYSFTKKDYIASETCE